MSSDVWFFFTGHRTLGKRSYTWCRASLNGKGRARFEHPLSENGLADIVYSAPLAARTVPRRSEVPVATIPTKCRYAEVVELEYHSLQVCAVHMVARC